MNQAPIIPNILFFAQIVQLVKKLYLFRDDLNWNFSLSAYKTKK